MKEKGQSTIEYVLLVTAVVAVIILLTVSSHNNSPLQQKLNNTVMITMNGMETEAERLTNAIVNQ